jgi:potassium channel subfamily K
VSSLYKAVREIGEENVIQKHVDRMREKALERTVTSFDFRRHEHNMHHLIRKRKHGFPNISTPADPRPLHTVMGHTVEPTSTLPHSVVSDVLKINRKPKLMLLKEEKDRFDAMRQIQAESKKFRRWMALFWSVTTFSILWCIGAVVFWQAEKDTQGLTYFQALYFCYISLLTIGYGDLAPKSNAGRCFFVIWSLIAVPTMTILVSDLGDTVVAKFKKWSDQLADFTVLPKEGIWLLDWLQRRIASHETKRRLREGFDVADPRNDSAATTSNLPEGDADDPQDPDLELTQHPTIPELAAEAEADSSAIPTHASLSRRLALSIKKVSHDFRLPHPRRYTYEEWVEFTRLIRMTTPERLDRDLGTTISNTVTENEEGLVNWDWIGNDSPMMSGLTESEWLLERLCESLVRLERRKEVACEMGGLGAMREMEGSVMRDQAGDSIGKTGELGGDSQVSEN